MRRLILAAGSASSLVLAAPAWAGYIDVTYSGTIRQVAAGAPSSLSVGTPINFDVVFDTSKLVDYTTATNQSFGGSPLFSSVQLASLSDDPLASLSITVGSITFSKFDQRRYGTTGGLAGANLPAAEYLNGSFAGVGNIFVNSQGYSLDADPIADAAIRRINNPAGSEFGFGGPQTGNFDFYLGLGTVSNPFTTGLALGNIDIATVRVTAVPEPSTWALLLGGMAALSGVLRFGRSRGRS